MDKRQIFRDAFHRPARPAWLFACALALLGGNTAAIASVPIGNVPLSLPDTVPGNLVLVPSVEWPTVVTQANDPGVAETSANYAPATVYAGYFNVNLCYAYRYDGLEANRYFYPVVAAGTAHSCSGLTGGTPSQKLWSGNFLNWTSMQAIDTFRLALTGGYRVHVPADGTPPSVTITGADLGSVTKATSEMPGVTYLEKANSDRWDNGYTKLRRLAANVADATPSATSSFRTRIGALRNQMWFLPNFDSNADEPLGDDDRSYSDPRALSLPVTNGDQGDPGLNAVVARPYNPSYHSLPNANTTTTTNGTACGTDEVGCTTADPGCDTAGGYSWNGSSCTKVETKLACPNSGSLYFKTSSSGGCYRNSSDDSLNEDDQCDSGWTRPTSNGTDKVCTRTITGTSTPQWTHTVYGKDQVYAVSIRVKVCDGTLDMRDICTPYGSNYKPEGLLQSNSKKIRYSLFSYLTETGQTRNGGVMRARQKLIGPVTAAELAESETPYPDRSRIAGIDNPEWDLATGVFINNPDAADTTATNGNIGSCASTSTPDGSQCQIQYSGVINYLNRFGQIATGLPTLKSFDNLSEMYYTALRYLRGEANVSGFSSLTGNSVADYQNADGLPVIEDWFKTGANTSVRRWNTSPALSTGTDGDPVLYQCQTSVMLGIGDTSTNNEDDEDNKSKDSVAAGGTWRGYTEYTSGGNGRGNLAGLAYWGHLNDLRSDVPNMDVAGGAAGAKRGQTISTYWVDVVERNDLFATTTNQFYNATKYGGYTIPDADWGTGGNATRHDSNWFGSNAGVWTSATQTVKTATGLGGTGDYKLPNNMFLANNGQKMIDGLNTAFQKIAEDLTGSGASLAANSTKLETGTTTYQAVYYSGRWRGDLKAFPVNPSTGVISATPTWIASSSGVFPAAASRTIKTYNPSLAAGSREVAFTTPANLSTAQQNALGTSTTVQQAVINYLRGDASNEKKNGGSYRSRDSALGDIIDSQPVYVGPPDANLFFGRTFAGSASYQTYVAANRTRAARIWVAANDGMVHSFNASTGAEVFAFLPDAVIRGGIKNLSDPNYGGSSLPHQYFNDGELAVADVYYSSAWHTVLVGTTGRAAAKAVYALDVTDPATPRVLWERSATDGLTNSNYIGQVIGRPVVAQTADGSWSVLMGNGYNSTNGTAALLKFNILTGGLDVYTTDTETDNGLAAPAVWLATPTNGISTTAYAGDLNGKVWAFALSGITGTNLFTAVDASNAAQPITAGMLAGKDPTTGNLWLFFGTGRYLAQAESTSTDLQTWYGIIVQSSTSSLVSNLSSGRSALREREILVEQAATSTSIGARVISSSTAGDMVGKSGWYTDLVVSGGTARGERMVLPNQFQGSLLIGTTRISESSGACGSSGSGWIMAINPFTGSAPASTFFDINYDGQFNTSDYITVGGTTYVVAGVGFSSIPNSPIFVGNTMLISFDNASTGNVNTRGSVGVLRRQSWREVVGQ